MQKQTFGDDESEDDSPLSEEIQGDEEDVFPDDFSEDVDKAEPSTSKRT